MFRKSSARQELAALKRERDASRTAANILSLVLRNEVDDGVEALANVEIGRALSPALLRPEVELQLLEGGVKNIDDLLTEYLGLPQETPPTSLQDKYGFSDDEVAGIDLVLRGVGWADLIEDERLHPTLGPDPHE